MARVRIPPDPLSIRDRLAGRTLGSGPRKAGSNPAPGTNGTRTSLLVSVQFLRCTRSAFGTSATKGDVCRRTSALFLENLAPIFTLCARVRNADPGDRRGGRVRGAILSSVAQWQGTRLLTGALKVHFASLRGSHCTPSTSWTPYSSNRFLPLELTMLRGL